MAHLLWSDRPVGVKLGAIVVAGAVYLGAFALITVQALNGTGDTTDQILSTVNRNVAEAAQSAGQIAENIDAVAAATNSTTSAMNDAQAAIDEVARMATSLHSSVARFRY